MKSVAMNEILIKFIWTSEYFSKHLKVIDDNNINLSFLIQELLLAYKLRDIKRVSGTYYDNLYTRHLTHRIIY